MLNNIRRTKAESLLVPLGLSILMALMSDMAAAQWRDSSDMPMDYTAYVEDFNSGDDAGLVEEYFAEDTVMISGSGEFHGHKGMNEFLAWAHDGVREILRPQVVLWDDHHIFAEIDMDFVASKPRPEFPFGNLKPGDIVTVKFFANYTINDEGKISKLKTMTWEPERRVSKAPRLGDHPGQRASFLAYTRAFSAGDAERYSAFYTDDVVLELSSVGTLKGKEAIVAFYTDMFQTVQESLEVNNIVYDDHGIVGDFVSVFTAVEDAPDFVIAPLKKGEALRVPVFVHYTLEDGLISHIKVVRSGEPSYRN